MTENCLDISLETLTPMWTGGVNQQSERLHLTGLMGSLRWWYEVMVRGMGGFVCELASSTSSDASSNSKCLYNSAKPETFQNLCDVCRIFGTTGWARRFRMIMLNEKDLLRKDPSRPYATIADTITFSTTGSRRPSKWYLKGVPLNGKIEMRALATGPTHPKADELFQIHIIGGLIQFLADWANVGAKPQMGLGVIQATMTPLVNSHHLMNHLQALAGSVPHPWLPSLQNMFFASVQPPTTAVEETFNLKYDLRDLFRSSFQIRHFVMGTTRGSQDDHKGAKIMMSRPYSDGTRTAMRVWGWIPEEVGLLGVPREQVIDRIHSHIKTKYTLHYWREWNSIKRDTILKKSGKLYGSPAEFLYSLLQGEGKV